MSSCSCHLALTHRTATELPTNKSDPDVSAAGGYGNDTRSTALHAPPRWQEEDDRVSPLGSPKGHVHHASTSTTHTLTDDPIVRRGSHRVSDISGSTSGGLSRQSEIPDGNAQP